MLKIATATMTLAMPPPRIATMPMASRMPGKREQHVADAHDDAIPPAFEVAGERGRARCRSPRRRRPRRSPAVSEMRAPIRMRLKMSRPSASTPNQCCQRRPRVELVVVEEILGVVRHDPRRRRSRRRQQHHERARDERDLLLLELAPELRPRRAHGLGRARDRIGRRLGVGAMRRARCVHQR